MRPGPSAGQFGAGEGRSRPRRRTPAAAVRDRPRPQHGSGSRSSEPAIDQERQDQVVPAQAAGSLTAPLPGAPEHPVPPLAGQQHLPPELPRGLLVPAVDAPAGVAEQAVTWAVTQAMPAVPGLGHAPLLTDFARRRAWS